MSNRQRRRALRERVYGCAFHAAGLAASSKPRCARPSEGPMAVDESRRVDRSSGPPAVNVSSEQPVRIPTDKPNPA